MRLGSAFGFVRSLVAVAGAVATSACVVEHDPVPYEDVGGESTSTAVPSGSATAGGTDAAAGSIAPVKAVVDTGKTLNAAPGQGVGVFIEYASGGRWHVWWTCDTSTTNEPCAYSVAISSAASALSAISLEQGAMLAQGVAIDGDGGVAGATTTPLVVTSNTSETADGVRFATNPGATIRVDAQLGGAENGSILFFVQNGKVNGGYTGVLSDPLDLAPSSP